METFTVFLCIRLCNGVLLFIVDNHLWIQSDLLYLIFFVLHSKFGKQRMKIGVWDEAWLGLSSVLLKINAYFKLFLADLWIWIGCCKTQSTAPTLLYQISKYIINSCWQVSSGGLCQGPRYSERMKTKATYDWGFLWKWNKYKHILCSQSTCFLCNILIILFYL